MKGNVPFIGSLAELFVYQSMRVYLGQDFRPSAGYRPPPPRRNFVHYDFLKLQYISHKMRRYPVESGSVIMQQQHHIGYPINSKKSFSTNTIVSFLTLMTLSQAIYTIISIQASICDC